MATTRPSIARALVLSACLWLASCSSIPEFPARGEFLGETFETPVDSEVARYYLEKYLQGKNEDPGMHARIDAVHRRYDQPIPSREELARVSREMSVDFAALFLAQRLLANPCNRDLNRSFVHYLADTNAAGADATPYLLLFVPGWDYADMGHLTGADFARPRELATRYGFENHLVALRPTGSVEENARILAAAVARHALSGKKILLAGSSSAGPTIHLALGTLVGANEMKSIAAWLNIGGLLQGSPIVEHFRSGPRRWFVDLGIWWKGWSHDAVASLGTGPGRRRFQEIRIDADILVVNYLGIPMSGQVGRHARDTYPVLKRDGPNDGLTLLADAIAPGSLTIVALGSDHFFADDPRIDAKTVALMRLMIAYLEKRPAKATGSC
ncbi:MAG: hypothetical protein M3R58_03900 [Pseudomonadota bacterium]|nr:hypothetical protein [Pseudomonadota bacterium]